MTREELVELLAAHRTIGSAPRQELLWIAEHGSLRHFEQGEQVTTHTEEVDTLHILLTGCVSIYVNRGTGLRKVMEWRGGDVTGILPYSRLKTPPGDTYVEEPTDSVVLSRDDLPALIRNCHEVTSILVHVMTDRARQFTSTDLRNEKMISLGKLAAGFAHEINNPASAALRDAGSGERPLIDPRSRSSPPCLRALEGAAGTPEHLPGPFVDPAGRTTTLRSSTCRPRRRRRGVAQRARDHGDAGR
ncbi:MAG: hypothetical protein MZV64_28505 [Ignavibacteriales bacterium]|nr:hypothetical protein [Ignavibacteriales bacterium]